MEEMYSLSDIMTWEEYVERLIKTITRRLENVQQQIKARHNNNAK